MVEGGKNTSSFQMVPQELHLLRLGSIVPRAPARLLKHRDFQNTNIFHRGWVQHKSRTVTRSAEFSGKRKQVTYLCANKAAKNDKKWSLNTASCCKLVTRNSESFHWSFRWPKQNLQTKPSVKRSRHVRQHKAEVLLQFQFLCYFEQSSRNQVVR